MATLADLKQEYCRSCSAPIYWLRNDTTGRPAPIDVRPVQDGPVIITADGGQLHYHVLSKAEKDAGVSVTRYANHFQTCPNAKQHHKGA
jgi:hypothetical protein